MCNLPATDVSKTTGRLPAARGVRTATATPWGQPPRPVTCTPASASASLDLEDDVATSAKKITTEIRR